MNNESTNPNLDELWEKLLSRRPDQILRMVASLTEEERSAVVVHLKRMAEEPGWHAEQRKSALIALKTIGGSRPAAG